jgi:hypothetical protein
MSRAFLLAIVAVITLSACSKDKAKLPVLRTGTPSKPSDKNKGSDRTSPTPSPTPKEKKETADEETAKVSCLLGTEGFEIDPETGSGTANSGSTSVTGTIAEPSVTLTLSEGSSTVTATADLNGAKTMSLDTQLSTQDSEQTSGRNASCTLPAQDPVETNGFVCDVLDLSWNGKSIQPSPGVGLQLTLGSGRSFLAEGKKENKYYSVVADVASDSMTVFLGQYTTKDKLFDSKGRQLGWVRIRKGIQSVTIQHTVNQTVGSASRQILLQMTCHSSN